MPSIPSFLRAHNLSLNKDLGQHFLIDEVVLQNIVDTAKISQDDHIVEIGPGIGVLTRELVQHAKHVTAIELDDRFINLIPAFADNPDNLTIIHGNALDVDLPQSPHSIVANIPYHITSALLKHAYLESVVRPRSMTLLIQREVAERICADKDRGRLTILVQLFGTPRIACNVPPDAFLPPPKVDSAVLHIDTHDDTMLDSKTIDSIFALTKIGFSQKRKMLRNTIGSLPHGMALLEQAEIDPTRRPQTLTMKEWILLAQAA